MHGLRTIHQLEAQRSGAFDIVNNELVAAKRRIAALEAAARAVFGSLLLAEQQKAIHDLKCIVDGPRPLGEILQPGE